MHGERGNKRLLIKALARSVLMLLALLAPSAFAASLYSAPRYAAILIDNSTGEVLYARRADEARYPASITKVMTLYVAFEEVAAGRLRLDDDIRISRRARGQAPSKLGLRVGTTISVKDAFGVIATKSANDIAVALAEHISGSEAAFAERMTATARRIGMMNTLFRNASGLPNPDHITTARDIATLSRAMLRDFPDLYPVFSQAQYRYRGLAVENHNHLLRTMPGVDGIKTGFTNAAGFTLAASAVRGDHRLVAVVLGGPRRLGRGGVRGGAVHVGHRLGGGGSGRDAGDGAVRAVHGDRLGSLGIREHREDEVTGGRDLGRGRRHGGAELAQGLSLGYAAVVDHHVLPGAHQPGRHLRAHDAETQEADPRGGCGHLAGFGYLRGASVGRCSTRMGVTPGSREWGHH